jgi:hypothetical protein
VSLDGAGAQGSLLPGWAQVLRRDLEQRYTLTTMLVHDGRAVVAIKSGSGPGPLLVITRDEDEMLTALGMKPPEPSPVIVPPGAGE